MESCWTDQELESTDMKVVDSKICAAEDAKKRKRDDWFDTCKRLGLARQAQIEIASEHYKEVGDLMVLGCIVGGAKLSESGDCRRKSKKSRRLLIRAYRNSRGITAIVDDVEMLNTKIPYGVLLAMEEAKAIGCFDRFSVVAPARDFLAYSPRNADPALLGVVDSPNGRPECAAYFEIAGWER